MYFSRPKVGYFLNSPHIAEIQVDCSGAGQHHGIGVSAMAPAVGEVLGHLYKLQRKQYCA